MAPITFQVDGKQYVHGRHRRTCADATRSAHRLSHLLSALAWRDRQPIDPYERPNLNQPAVVVAFAPLTSLSERNALGVFTLIGVACVVIAARRISRVVPQVPWFVLASLVFALEGGWTNLWLGQQGLVLMLVRSCFARTFSPICT